MSDSPRERSTEAPRLPSRAWVVSCLFAFGLSGCADRPDTASFAPLLGPPTLVRISQGGALSEEGSLRFSFSRSGATAWITNVAADLNGDGDFAAYTVNGRTQEEWLVQNALLATTEANHDAFLLLVDPGLAAGASVRVLSMVGDQVVAAPWTGSTKGALEARDDTLSLIVEDRPILVDPEVGAIGSARALAQQPSTPDAQPDPPAPPPPPSPPSPATQGFGDPVDEVQQGPGGAGETLVRKGLPDVTQDSNTCVGHSIANSVSWLARKCGFADRLPDVGTTQGVDDLAATVLEAYGEIDGLVYDSRGELAGVRTDATVMLNGKNKFAENTNLPITSEILSRPGGTMTFDSLAQKMKDGCDVELVVLMLDPDTDSPLGYAHAVTLAGYSDGPGGKTFSLNDPGTDGTGADLHKLSVSQRGGLTFPYTFEGKKTTALVEFALVECCTPAGAPASQPTAPDPAAPAAGAGQN